MSTRQRQSDTKPYSQWKGTYLIVKLMIGLLVILVISLSALAVVFYKGHMAEVRRAVNEQADQHFASLSRILAPSLAQGRLDWITATGAALAQDKTVRRIQISDAAGRIVYQSSTVTNPAQSVARVFTVHHQGRIVGEVSLHLAMQQLTQLANRQHKALALQIGGVLIFIFIAVGLLIRLVIRRPLSALQHGIDRIAAGDYRFKFGPIRQNELRGIARRFSQMAGEIESRENRLQDMNRKLQAQIEERRQAEAAVKESEHIFRNLFDLSPQAITLTRLDDGTLINVNRRFCEIVKFDQAAIIGRTSTEMKFYSPAARKRFVQQLTDGANHEVLGLEMTIQAKDGSNVQVQLFARIIEVRDVKYIIAIMHDVTEQRKLERQVRQAHKMEAIGTLAGGIAHDFNNILSAIVGYAELLRMDAPENTPPRRYLDKILSSADRAKNLVSQILTFSRQSDSSLQSVQPKLIIKEVLKLMRASLPSNIEIQGIMESDAHVLADPTLIHQMVMNLCTNAGTAMQANGGLLTVALTDFQMDAQQAARYDNIKPGPFVSITISDTGGGMPRETVERIFDPFFTTGDTGEGIGMGLSVVHGIVKDRAGEVTVKSEVGKGTQITLLLPAMATPERNALFTPPGKPATGNEKILLVDDEAFQVDLGTQLLKRLGYRVVALTDCMEALSLFRKQPHDFDLVITDLTMPHMAGDTFARKIMSVRPDAPIILCTGFSDRITEEEVLAMGVKAFMWKPFVISNMAATIRRVLDDAANV